MDDHRNRVEISETPTVEEAKLIIWQRHRNPLSGWFRYGLAISFAIAVWHHSWLILLGLVALAIINPIFFPPPKNTDAFMTRAIDGERVWHYRSTIREKFMVLSIPGLLVTPTLWALYNNELIWTALLGSFLLVHKHAFMSRMVEIAGRAKYDPAIGPLPPSIHCNGKNR